MQYCRSLAAFGLADFQLPLLDLHRMLVLKLGFVLVADLAVVVSGLVLVAVALATEWEKTL